MDQAAAELGVGPKMVVRLVAVDGLPADRRGMDLSINRPALDAWLERQRVRPGDLAGSYPPRAGQRDPRPRRASPDNRP